MMDMKIKKYKTMKTLKNIFRFSLVLLFLVGCEDEDHLDFVQELSAPTNVSASIRMVADNTGLTYITPLAEGAVSYTVDYGDGSGVSESISIGKTTEHIYAEGNYEATITAFSLDGKETSVSQDVLVSFNAPENLVVTIENDGAVSKQVNITATADWAMSYDVYFGEDDEDTPISVNIGETVSYTYQEAGTYTIKVVAMSAAIETTEYTEEFQVTAIIQPLTSATTPPNRGVDDVISIYSSVYDDVVGTNYFPDWGQGGQGSS